MTQSQPPLPDSASLSDSLSSSELELLEAFPWPGGWLCPVWTSSSSSSTGVLGRAGCFSRSWRQIFSLLLIREIEVLQGRGQGGAEQQVACRELISEGTHSTCSRLKQACNMAVGESVGHSLGCRVQLIAGSTCSCSTYGLTESLTNFWILLNNVCPKHTLYMIKCMIYI